MSWERWFLMASNWICRISTRRARIYVRAWLDERMNTHGARCVMHCGTISPTCSSTLNNNVFWVTQAFMYYILTLELLTGTSCSDAHVCDLLFCSVRSFVPDMIEGCDLMTFIYLWLKMYINFNPLTSLEMKIRKGIPRIPDEYILYPHNSLYE